MEACTERHARIKLDDNLAWSRVVVMPRCFHQHPASDAMDAVVRLPGVRPIFFLPFGDTKVADRAEPAKVPECLTDLFDLPRRNVGRIEERSDDDWPGRINGEVVTIRILRECLFDGDTLIEPV